MNDKSLRDMLDQPESVSKEFVQAILELFAEFNSPGELMNLISAIKQARALASESSDNSTIEHDSLPSVADLIEGLEEDFAEEIARP